MHSKLSKRFAAMLMTGLVLPTTLLAVSIAAPYPKNEVTDFMNSCKDSCSAQLKQYGKLSAKVCQSTCECNIKNLQSDVPYDKFVTYTNAVSKKNKPEAAMETKMGQIARMCTIQGMKANGIKPAVDK